MGRGRTFMAVVVGSLAQRHGFSDQAQDPLGKIINHCKTAKFDKGEMKKALHLSCVIAQAYTPDPIQALYQIEEGFQRYVARYEAGTFDVGSIDELAIAEARVRRQGTPVIPGLKTRIEEHLLGIDGDSSGNFGRRRGKNSPLASHTRGRSVRYKNRECYYKPKNLKARR